MHSKSLGALSCVHVIPQSRVIDKVYLNNRLHKVLWKVLLHFLARVTFSEDVVFQNSQFATPDFVFTVTLSIHYLAISPTNTGVFRP